ncbi:unnamed protein product [Boreogadus saida]
MVTALRPSLTVVFKGMLHMTVGLTARDAWPMRGVMRVTWSWATPLLITMVLLRLVRCEENPLVPDLLLLVGPLSPKLADADWAAAPEDQMNLIGLRRMVHWLHTSIHIALDSPTNHSAVISCSLPPSLPL